MRDFARLDWAVTPLGDLVDVLDRLRKPITKKDRKAGVHPYYGATGVLDYVDGYLFDEPLVLIGEDGAKWEAGENSSFAIDGKTWVNNHAHVIRPNRDLVLDEWLIYYLNGADLMPFVSGLTVPKLNQGRLREIPIPLPPLEEQQRIVAVLDEAFEGLARARAHAEANLQNARELFEAYRETVFSRLLASESIKSLGEISSRVSVGHVGQTSSHYVEEGGVQFLRSQNVRPDGIDLRSVRKITEQFHQGLKKSQLKGGELLFVRVGANRGDCCLMPPGLGETNCANIVFARPKEGNLSYIEHYCQSAVGRSKLLGMTTGSAQGVINTKSVATLPVPCPNDAEQEEISRKLGALRREAMSLEDNYRGKICDFADLRQSLLQTAFAGELT